MPDVMDPDPVRFCVPMVPRHNIHVLWHYEPTGAGAVRACCLRKRLVKTEAKGRRLGGDTRPPTQPDPAARVSPRGRRSARSRKAARAARRARVPSSAPMLAEKA